jgi:hypothetical protein
MAVRTGVEYLIKLLRGMTNAGTADYTIAGEEYWSDDDMADTLDLYRTDVFREQLVQIITNDNSGSAQYFDYFFSNPNAEQHTSGTVLGKLRWELENSAGSVIGTADYQVDYQGQYIRFDNSQAGTSYFLNYSHFNLNRAAANIWRRKAAQTADRFHIETDNHNLRRQQIFQHYISMAKMYEAADPRIITVRRADIVPNADRRGAFAVKV